MAPHNRQNESTAPPVRWPLLLNLLGTLSITFHLWALIPGLVAYVSGAFDATDLHELPMALLMLSFLGVPLAFFSVVLSSVAFWHGRLIAADTTRRSGGFVQAVSGAIVALNVIILMFFLFALVRIF